MCDENFETCISADVFIKIETNSNSQGTDLSIRWTQYKQLVVYLLLNDFSVFHFIFRYYYSLNNLVQQTVQFTILIGIFSVLCFCMLRVYQR